MAKASRYRRNMQSFYRLLTGFSEVEKKYIEYIFNLEKGKRSKNEIQDEFRKLVIDDPQVRFPEYSSEKVLKDFRKLINNK